MKILSTLYKRLKNNSLSVWRFIHDEETNRFFAINMESLKTIPANDADHLKHIHTNYLGYGFSREIPAKRVRKVAPPVKKVKAIADPWASQLPLDLQQELDQLVLL